MLQNSSAEDEREVRRLVETYAAGVALADTGIVASVFADDARMWGWLGDSEVIAPITAFLDVVRQSESDPDRAAGYSYEVVDVVLRSRMAVVTFRETGYLGQDFTNTFTFLKRSGQWRAVTKTFTSPAD